MFIDSSTLEALFVGFKTNFKNGFKESSPEWSKVATRIKSNTSSENYGWLGQFPKMREWVDERILKNLKAHDYSIINKDYEATVQVPKNAIDDDTLGIYDPIFRDMGNSAAMHPDELVFALLAAGAASASLCYDGQPFFNASHPVGDSTASNYDVTGGGNMWILMDTKRPLKPIIYQERQAPNFQVLNNPTDSNVFFEKKLIFGVDSRSNVGYGLWQLAYASLNSLDATNFNAARTAMRSLKSDEGRSLNVNPNLLVVGPSNEVLARTLLAAEYGSAGASNINYKAVDLLVSSQLT